MLPRPPSSRWRQLQVHKRRASLAAPQGGRRRLPDLRSGFVRGGGAHGTMRELSWRSRAAPLRAWPSVFAGALARRDESLELLDAVSISSSRSTSAVDLMCRVLRDCLGSLIPRDTSTCTSSTGLHPGILLERRRLHGLRDRARRLHARFQQAIPRASTPAASTRAAGDELSTTICSRSATPARSSPPAASRQAVAARPSRRRRAGQPAAAARPAAPHSRSGRQVRCAWPSRAGA